jgi:3-dehydroquinate dehydratase type I
VLLPITNMTGTKRRRESSVNVCVSVYGRNTVELKANAKEALGYNPGYIELRLDYLTTVIGKVSQIAKLDRGSNYIFTFRATEEGGRTKVSDALRQKILLEIIRETRWPMIDVEIKTLDLFPDVLEAFETQFRPRKSRLIASSHDFKKNESLPQLKELVLSVADRYSPAIIKVVRQANEFSDNLRMLELYDLTEEIMPTKLVSFCTGPLGVFSRIACVSYGSPFTFASLPNQNTAAGQLDVESMNVLLNSWR